MAQVEYTYKRQGVTQAYLDGVMPGTGTVGDQVPAAYLSVTWEDTYKTDLDSVMEGQGWAYLWQGPPPAAKTVIQTQTAALAGDASSIGVASGWQDIGLSPTLATRGGSTVTVQLTAIGSPTLAPGQVRVLVSGGAYSDTVVGAAAYAIQATALATTSASFPVPIADTSPDETTYTFRVQMQAPGALNAIVPKAYSRISLAEHK